jgi:aspartate/tyrosine/aromatic aminotransferase
VPEDQELTDADWRTLCDTLRGSIAMFDMLLAECGNSSETARVVGDARRRREKVLENREALATLTAAANFGLFRPRIGRWSSKIVIDETGTPLGSVGTCG